MTKLQEIKNLLNPSPPPGRSRNLSATEAQVFQMIGEGMSTREIAKVLGRSVKTVETHRAHLKLKLNIPNGSKLVYWAVLVGAEK